MQLSLFILQNGIEVVSQSDQLEYEPKVHLVNPCTISGTTKLTLKRWPVHAKDEHILLRSDDLLTVCEATDEVTKAYIKKFKLSPEDLTSDPEPVMLNEEQQVMSQDPNMGLGEMPDFEDDYEPRYVEDAY